MTACNRILLVEDNPDDEELTIRALKPASFTTDVIVAHDGEEALQLLGNAAQNVNSCSSLPKVVFLDLKLPKMGGLDVLKHIRADPQTRFVPVVVLTSSNEEEDIRASFRLGANSYVRKPIQYDRLMEEVQQIAAYWLSINQVPIEVQTR